MEQFAQMNKIDLRAACKEAGIKGYSKMTVAQMRDELVAIQPADLKVDLYELDENGDDGNCPNPKCGVHLSNGVMHVDNTDLPEKDRKDFHQEFECMACGQQWGPEVDWSKSEDRHTGNGLKIEKDRPEQNGVKRPSAGGKCRAIWDALDEYVADEANEGAQPTVGFIKEVAAEEGWNVSNAAIEFYQWRKFNGFSKK